MRMFAWVFWACASPEVPATKPEVVPPLYQTLYAGENGAQARALGDRLRILVWLRALKLTGSQTKGLSETSQQMLALKDRLQKVEEDQAAAEMRVLAPLYRDLAQTLEHGSEEELADANRKIREAQKTLGSPQTARLSSLREMLGLAERWLGLLEPSQKLSFQHALFFLRNPVSPQLSPVYYDALVGTAWPDDSFASLRRLTPGSDEKSLDIGSLWTLDAGQTDGSAGLEGLQLQVLTVLALLHPQLPVALQILEGQRPFDDGTAP